MNKDTVCSSIMMCCLAMTLVAGGTSLPSRNLFLVLSIVNFCLLGLAVWHMRFVPLPHTSKPTLMIISATLITMGLDWLAGQATHYGT
jgi:hypothetical protein